MPEKRAEIPQRNPYILTIRDFSTAIELQDIKNYIPFEPVSRANFTSFLIRSFAEARGKLNMQTIFCSLVEAQSGFQVAETLVSLGVGDHSILPLLTPEEQLDLFTVYDGFAELPVHKVKIAHHLFSKQKIIHRALDMSEFDTALQSQTAKLVKKLQENDYAFSFAPTMTFKEFESRRDRMLY